MARDQRNDDEPRNLDVFEELANDEDDGTAPTSDPQPAVTREPHLPDVARAGEDTDDGDIFADDGGLDLDAPGELQASAPDPTLNLPDDAADADDGLDYAGPDETLTFSNDESGSPGDELQYSGPEPELNLSNEAEDDGEDDGEPVPSVPEGESGEVIVFDEEANQGQPADPGDDEPANDDPDGPLVPVPPDPVSDDESDFSEAPDLPQISALPEPPYELEFNPDPPYDFSFENTDNEDEDMGDG